MSEMTTRCERGASAPPALPRVSMTVIAAICAVALADGQGQKSGSPEENLPPNVTQLTGFGERASWSPDGRRIAFMSRSFGDAFVVDVATKVIRLLTHYPSAGYLRVQYLPNGDYLLIGARTFTDIGTTRGRDQEMWILEANGSGQPVPLEHKISEGVAISRTLVEDCLVEYPRPVSRSPGRGRVGPLHGGYRQGRWRTSAGQQEGDNAREGARMHARSAGLPQRGCRTDLHLLSHSVCRRVRRRSRIREGHDLSQAVGRVQRSRRDFSRRRVHAGRIEPRSTAAELQLHRHLEAEARTGQHGLRPRDALGRVPRVSRPRIPLSARMPGRSRFSRRAVEIQRASDMGSTC